MNKDGTILKAIQAALLVTALTPEAVHADPLSTRQMLAQAQAQSQDQAVKGEVKKINRGLILGTAEAATNPSALHPVEAPAVSAPAVTTSAATVSVATVEASQVDVPALPLRSDDAPVASTIDMVETAAASATISTMQAPLIVTLSAPAQPATDTVVPMIANTPTTDAAAKQVPLIPIVSSAAVANTPEPVRTPVDIAKTTTAAEVDASKADASTARSASTKAANAQRSREGHTRGRGSDSLGVGGFKLSGENMGSQLTKIMNRPDVKSILAQYGLN